MITEFYDRVDGDMSMSFGGLYGRGRKKQDESIERDLALALEEVYHGCTKKMKVFIYSLFHCGLLLINNTG